MHDSLLKLRLIVFSVQLSQQSVPHSKYMTANFYNIRRERFLSLGLSLSSKKENAGEAQLQLVRGWQ